MKCRSYGLHFTELRYIIEVLMEIKNHWSMLLIFFVGISLLLMLLHSIDGSGRTITVDDDGGEDFTKIQDAINSAQNGDVVRVWKGEYTDHLTINSSLSLIGNGSHGTTITGGEVGRSVVIGASKTNIQGFSIFGNLFINADDVRIENNTINSTTAAITFSGNRSSVIVHNNTFRGGEIGIQVSSAHSISMEGNTFSGMSEAAIRLERSIGCSITNTTMTGCGITFTNSYERKHWESQTFGAGNSVNGLPLVVIKGLSGNRNVSKAGQMILINCSNVTLEYVSISGTSEGLTIAYSHQISVGNSTISENTINGIGIYFSTDVSIHNSNCSSNLQNGVLLHAAKKANISRCMFSENGNGICLQNESSDNRFQDIKCSGNKKSGMEIDDSHGDFISRGIFTANFRGLTVDAPGNSNTTFNFCLVDNNEVASFIRSDNCVVDNSQFSNCTTGNGLEISHANNIILRDSIFSSNGGIGVLVDVSSRITITRCRMFGNGKSGLLLYDSSEGYVSDCVLTSNADGIIVQGHFWDYSYGHTFTNVTCSLNDGNGIYITESKDCTISGSFFEENEKGFDIGHGTQGEIIIQHCTIRNNTSASRISNNDCLVYDCVFESTREGTGLEIWWGLNNRISKCTFIKNNGYGIWSIHHHYEDHTNIIEDTNIFRDNKNGDIHIKAEGKNEFRDSWIAFLSVPFFISSGAFVIIILGFILSSMVMRRSIRRNTSPGEQKHEHQKKRIQSLRHRNTRLSSLRMYKGLWRYHIDRMARKGMTRETVMFFLAVYGALVVIGPFLFMSAGFLLMTEAERSSGGIGLAATCCGFFFLVGMAGLGLFGEMADDSRYRAMIRDGNVTSLKSQGKIQRAVEFLVRGRGRG